MILPRTFFLPLLVIFALLFAQQAGGIHAVHHSFKDLTQRHAKGKLASHTDNCDKCAQYAQLGSALNASSADLLLPSLSVATVQQRAVPSPSSPFLTPSARAPPSLA